MNTLRRSGYKMDTYNRFAKLFKAFVIGKQFNMTESYGNSPDSFISHISYNLVNGKLFEMSNDVKKMLALTKPPNLNNNVHLPHPIMFIDVTFSKAEMEQLGINIGYNTIIGIIISVGTLLNAKDNTSAGTALRITMCSERKDKDIWFDTFNSNLNLAQDYENYKVTHKREKRTNDNARRFAHLFAINCINFINDPEVEWKFVKTSIERNDIRAKKNKFPIPNRHIVKLTGKVSRYVNHLNEIGGWKLHHKFWVRGHWRLLKSSKYKENAGKRIWVMPYIKGKGILVAGKYKMENI